MTSPKEDARQALVTLESEVGKPMAEQDSGRLAYVYGKLKAYGPALLQLIAQAEALINNRPRI